MAKAEKEAEKDNTTLDPKDAKGLVGLMMDFSFTDFVTPKIVKILYVIAILLAGLGALGLLIQSVMGGGAMAIVGIIVAPIAFVLWVIMARVSLEVALVLFRIEQNTRK